MPTLSLLLASLLTATSGIAVAASTAASVQAPAEPVLFSIESRVEIDATGTVTAVSQAPRVAGVEAPGLPPAVIEAAAGNIRKLRFAPPMKAGHAVSAVTWVQQEACAVPKGGAYQLALRYRGHGPSAARLAAPEDRRAPVFPREVMRAGASGTVHVTYLVRTSGDVEVEKVELTSGSKRWAKALEKSVSDWASGLRFEPELLDGLPVETRRSYPVEFKSGGRQTFSSMAAARRSHERADAAARQTRIASNDACQTALGAGDATPRHLALDSPVRLLDAN